MIYTSHRERQSLIADDLHSGQLESGQFCVGAQLFVCVDTSIGSRIDVDGGTSGNCYPPEDAGQLP